MTLRELCVIVWDKRRYILKITKFLVNGGANMARYKIICTALLMLLLAGCGNKAPIIAVVSGQSYTVTNAEGKSVRYSDDTFSGDMIVSEQQGMDTGQKVQQYRYFLEVPYSKSFTCQCDKPDSQTFGLLLGYDLSGNDPSYEGHYEQYTVSGEQLETITITVNGEMAVTAAEDGFMKTTFSLPCDALGELGVVQFLGAVGDNASVSPAENPGQFSFSGFLPGECVLSYTGTESSQWNVIALNVGSGTIDLSTVPDGFLVVTENDRDACVINLNY